MLSVLRLWRSSAFLGGTHTRSFIPKQLYNMSTPTRQAGGGVRDSKKDRFRGGVNRGLPALSHASSKAWADPFYFVQFADTQLGFFDDPVWNEDGTGKGVFDKEMVLVAKAVDQVNKMTPRPAFVTCCGDLTHALPGEDAYEAQVEGYKQLMGRIHEDIPIVCVCGNHDVGNAPTKDSIAAYSKNFGDDYFSFWHGGVKFIVINVQLYSDSSEFPEGLSKQQQWLEEELESGQKEGATHMILFQHIPWFLSDPEEEDQYFSIKNEVRQPALAMLNKYNVRACFAGHYHRNAGGKAGSMEMVTTSAIGKQLGEDKSGFRIVKVAKTHLEHQYHDLDQVPTKIDL